MNRLRVFVCEFITGGGLSGRHLPEGLAREGEMMLAAVTRDLLATERVQVLVTRDRRSPPTLEPVDCVDIGAAEDIWEVFHGCIRACDAVLPIAPETGGVLQRLSQMALDEDKLLLGSTPPAVKLVERKMGMARMQNGDAIHTIPTVFATSGCVIPASRHGWVIKPDDGAGCEDMWYFDRRERLEQWLSESATEDTILQPFFPGQPASLSVLCRQGSAQVLACNTQMVEVQAGRIQYHGVCVNGLKDRVELFTPLVEQVAAALPGLWGYVGLDVILSASGPILVEVNPRLTTSYVALRQSLGLNPAQMILQLLEDTALPQVDLSEALAVPVTFP